MPAINIGSIMNKVKAFSVSSRGKKQMDECIKKYAFSGRDVTAGGTKLTTESSMYEAVAKLKEMLIAAAQSAGLPESVMSHINSIESSGIVRLPNGACEIYLYFGGDLHRDSLYSDGYDGVQNIVAVLNNGYHARDYVYGNWDSHSHIGESVFDGDGTDSSTFIRSRKDREGLHFIQQAIIDFNGNYGADYNVTATAGEDYN